VQGGEPKARWRPRLEVLEDRTVPSIVATGADAGGGPQVNVFDGAGTLRFAFYAYPPSFKGGVRVAVGDVNHDGIPDIITAPGPGMPPEVRIFDGAHLSSASPVGDIVADFMAYDPAFLGGVYVASADVNHDGFADIVTGAGAGGGPHVRIFSGANGQVLGSFYAYSPVFTGGVRVAAGDVNADGFADIITGAGPGGGPHVRVFSGFDGHQLASFYAYSSTFTGGVYVAAGDVNADGFSDIITGSGPGITPEIHVYSGFDGHMFPPIAPFDTSFSSAGVRVSSAYLDSDFSEEIIASSGSGNTPSVKVFDGDTFAQSASWSAYAIAFQGGVFVGGG
jgi:hypothetical protein